MAVLFRPWTQPSESIQQDSTISTTTCADVDVKTEAETEAQSPDVQRQVKYRSVKEHIKKRSEKRLKLFSEKTPLPLSNTSSSFSIPPVQFPHFDGKLFESVNTRSSKDFWDDLSLMTPELLETAIAHGLPPGVVEDYARLLTEQQRQLTERNRKQRPKKFRCPHCRVGFSNNGQLKGHIRIHTGERPFKCDAEQCGKSFTRNEELTRHRRIHSGLRPFPCPECGKRFGRKDHLKKHVRTHFQQRYQLVPIYPSQFPYLFGL